MNIHRTIVCGFFICLSFLSYGQVDPDASEKTVTLYNSLKRIQNTSSFLFGQEFFNSFRFSGSGAHGEKEFSDSKDITGAHPALLGSDFHYYLTKGATERGYHTEAVKWAYQQGYVITYDWHLSARNTNSYEYVPAVKDLANNIVNDIGDDRAWLYSELDKIIDIINNDLVVNNENIPIVFRPFHEMNGGWFWWGSQATTSDNYKLLYQLLVDYMRPKVNTVLFCWSPNSPTNMNYFPGNDYVDILGVDIYEVSESSLRSNLAPIVDHAQANNKVAVLSETGNRKSNGDEAVMYWKNTVLPGIVNDPSGKSLKIAWALTWINASWSFSYVPYAGSSAAAKQNFIDFKNSPHVIFGDKLSAMYTPIPVVTAIEDGEQHKISVEFYPSPATDVLYVNTRGFLKPTTISMIDLLGRTAYLNESTTSETALQIKGILPPGLYILQVADQEKIMSRKVLVR